MSNLTDQFKQRIEERITKIEGRSSLEIVPVITQRSSDYFAWRVSLSLIAGILSLIGSSFFSPWGIQTSHWILAAAFSISFWLLLYWNPLLFALLPKRVFHEAIHDEAAQWFLKEEIFNTKSRTGLLIFVSEFERSAYVIADKGLLGVIPESRWALLGRQLADDFSRQSAGESFLKALDEIDQDLSKHFPRTAQDKDELSNRVRS